MPTLPTLSVLDDGAERTDLTAREERKFVFESADVAGLRNVLSRACTPIVYAGPVSEVHSVYFDDPRLGTCHANLDGSGVRHKTRIRWYDTPTPTQALYFETKWRRHRIVGKRRMHLATDDLGTRVDLHALRQSILRTVPAERQDYLALDCDPSMLVSYRREHFAHEASGARLTLDYDMRFVSQIGRRTLTTRHAHRLPGVALIECKSRVGGRRALDRILAPLHARPTRFSKYVTACVQLGFARSA